MVVAEDVRRAKRILDTIGNTVSCDDIDAFWGLNLLRKGLPETEHDKDTESNTHRGNNGDIARRFVLNGMRVWRDMGGVKSTYCGVDDTYKNQADSWNNKEGADIIKALNRILPRNSSWMLRWIVEEIQADERQKLQNESYPVDVLPISVS